VDVEEVKIVNAVVLELLLANRSNALGVVEGVPELADNEKILTLDKTFLDGAGESLAGFLLVAVIFNNLLMKSSPYGSLFRTYHKRRQIVCNQF